MHSEITEISVANVRGQLPAPVVFGDWVMNDREYVVVRVRGSSGHEGWSFTLTRDANIADHVRQAITPAYVSTLTSEREATFWRAQRRNLASNCAGIGLRALSVVDLAVWDLAARDADQSIAEFLGGQPGSMPATAIIGYPPAAMDAAAVRTQVRKLSQEGWQRFKMPVASTLTGTADRLRAARHAAPDAWIGCDAAWTFDEADAAASFLDSIKDVGLGWFEDVFPPGETEQLARLREAVDTKIAMGDEQGGSYYPHALIRANAVDVVRIDLTCMGGITGGRRVLDTCLQAGVEFSPHMFAHVHSQVFGAWGFTDAPIEWGVPWTGVDPYADSLEQPQILKGGRMKSLHSAPGFGPLVNIEWAGTQPHEDPDGILRQ